MDWLSSIFLGCFIFGLVFTVASFLLGGLGHLSGVDGMGHGAHVGHGADFGYGTQAGHGHGADTASHDSSHNHAASHNEAGGLNWLNFNALIVFVTWFGGAGFVLMALGSPGWVAVPLALVGGILGYFAILLFFSKVLYASQTPFMRSQDYNLTGQVARVSSPIFEGGTGEVIFTKFGTKRSAAARSLHGIAFNKDAQVVILRYENGVAYVEDLDKLLAEAGAEKWSTESLRGSESEKSS